MNKRNETIDEFVQDLYDLMGRNINFVTPHQFYQKWVKDDDAFMVDNNENVIYFDDFTIKVTPR